MPTSAPLCVPVAVPAAGIPIEEFADPDEDTAEQAELAVDAARLRRFVAALPERQRYVVIRHFGLFGCEPRGLRAISRDLAVGIGTVHRWERAALRALAAQF